MLLILRGYTQPLPSSATGNDEATSVKPPPSLQKIGSSPAASSSPASVPSPFVSTLEDAKLTSAPREAPANVTQESKVEDWRSDKDLGHSTFLDKLRQVIGSLALICILIWVFSKMVGRASLEKLGLAPESQNLIEILERVRVSPGRSVMLVRMGPKVLALGVTEAGFCHLAEIGSEELDAYRERIASDRKPGDDPSGAGEGTPLLGPKGVLKHYLSIIPTLGAKK